jgi:hypothetical protein
MQNLAQALINWRRLSNKSALAGALGLSLDVCQRSLANVVRKRGALAGPIAEARSEAVHSRGLIHAFQKFLQRGVAQRPLSLCADEQRPVVAFSFMVEVVQQFDRRW